MATIAKFRARKLLDSGKVCVAHNDLSFVGLETKKHISFTIGMHTIRVEQDKAKKMAEQILSLISEYGE